jgi:hypothetical protein
VVVVVVVVVVKSGGVGVVLAVAGASSKKKKNKSGTGGNFDKSGAGGGGSGMEWNDWPDLPRDSTTHCSNPPNGEASLGISWHFLVNAPLWKWIGTVQEHQKTSRNQVISDTTTNN